MRLRTTILPSDATPAVAGEGRLPGSRRGWWRWFGFRTAPVRRRRAFTIIETMVVLAIAAIMLTMAIPSIYRRLHPASMQRALNDVLAACDNARAYAILNHVETELVIRPADRQISVVVAPQRQEPGTQSMESPSVAGDSWRMPERGKRLDSPDVAGNEWRMPERQGASGDGEGGLFSATLAPQIVIEGLGINGEDWTEDEAGRVRFYPNGTSDEMSIVLLSEKGERRNVWLEVVTGLAVFETDPYKFKVR